MSRRRYHSWRRHGRSRGSDAHAVLFFDDDADAPPVSEEEAVEAAYELFGGRDAVEQAVIVEPWSSAKVTGWIVSACDRIDPPLRSLSATDAEAEEQVVLWHGNTREVIVPHEYFSTCTESHALMGRCPCPMAGASYTPEVSECVKTNILPALQVIPASALLAQRRRSDAWYHQDAGTNQVVRGFTYISGPLLSDDAGWVPRHLALGDIEPGDIAERRKSLSERSRRAAATKAAMRVACTDCAVSARCDKRSAVHRCGGTRTPEMLTRALERYMQEHDVRKHVEGAFTADQVRFLMAMGGSDVAGRTAHIRTRSKEVVLGTFTRETRWHSRITAFRVRAGARGYMRYTDFASWEELVATLPEVQSMFDAQFPYMEPLPERVYLLYSLAVDRHAYRRVGWGGARPLYYVCAHAGGVRYKYATDRYVEYYSKSLDLSEPDYSLVQDAYSYVANPEIVGT